MAKGWSVSAIQNLVRSVAGYQDPNRIAQDVGEVLAEQRSLVPKVEQFVKNDGSDNTLLVLDGTIPMIYGTKRYNCPVQIWLMQDYPATQPTCYVKPTHDMAIKPRHVHVDGAGFIYHQYLTEWNPRSNLKVLCNTLSQVFGKDPPVYAKPSTGAPAARPSARPAQSQPNPAAAQEAARPQAAVSAQPQPPKPQPQAQPKPQPQPAQHPHPHPQPHPQPQPQPAYQPPQPQPQPQQKRHSTENAWPQPGAGPSAAEQQAQQEMLNKRRSAEDIPRISEEERSRLELVALVSSKLQADYDRYMRASEEDFDMYQAKQNDLKDTRECIDNAVVALQAEKKNLLNTMQQLETTEQGVTAWLDARAKEAVPDVEQLVHASDAMAQQLLGAVAQVKAIEDVLYHLDQALDAGNIDTEEYLRLTLRLSRQQFFEKELTNKILARRRQLGVL